MRCPRCRTENRDGRRFCGECGTPLPIACPSCGALNDPGEKFCGACGAAVAKTAPAAAGPAPAAPVLAGGDGGERRQVTILFADLADYTQLSSGRDPEETHRLLGRFFEAADAAIRHYGGAIDKHMGDNVMAVFGAPLAHGDDPERAVRAALAIQAALAELSVELGVALAVHSGIASGEVMASGLGSAHHQEYTVTGEAVNLAARLQAKAVAGETLISDAVRRSVDRSVLCEDCGEVSVKGFAATQRVWRVTGLAASPQAPMGLFVGRRAELTQLGAIIDGCRDSGHGMAIHLRGDAGIGKTRLLDRFRAAAEQAGFACHLGQVLDFGAGKDRDAVRIIVASLLGLPLGSPEAARQATAAAAIAGGLVGDAQRIFLNDLLDLPQPPDLQALYEAMTNATRNRGKEETVAAAVRALAARRPLALIVEDIHWASRTILDHLAALTLAVAGLPALLVMTSRREGDPLDRAWQGAVQGAPLVTIDLAPLRPEEARMLAQGFAVATDRFLGRCIERAAGNPLFLEQLLRNAEAAGAMEVPPTIHSLVLARMDRLAAADKALLQAAAVVGQRFGLDVVRALLGDAGASCDTLVAHHLVRGEGEGFLFSHALIRDGVYSSLTRARRNALHRRAAEWFGAGDPVLRAEHLDRAEDDEAPRAYLAAARLESAAFHNERALALAQRGLALARDDGDRHALAAFKGELLREAGDGRLSLDAYGEALAAAREDAERCRALIGVAAAHRLIAGVDEALAALAQAEPIAATLGLDRALAEIHYTRGNLYFARGGIDACRTEHEAALADARRAGDPEWEARAVSGLGDAAYAQGRMVTALAHFRRCIALCDAHGFGRIAIANRVMVGHSRVYLNEFAPGLAEMAEGMAAAQQVGNRHAEMFARQSSAFLLTLAGETERAAAIQPTALAMARELGARRYEAIILAHQAETLVARGERAAARQTAEQAVALARDTGLGFCGPIALGILALASEDPAARVAALREGEALLAAGCISHNHFWFRRNAIEIALAERDWTGAERHAAALSAYTAAEPLPLSDLLVARARALAEHGRGHRGTALRRRLRALRDQAATAGLKMALPALDAALAG